jgi:hypothetical protein
LVEDWLAQITTVASRRAREADVPAGIKSLPVDTGSLDPGLLGRNWRSHGPFVRMLVTRKY